MLIKKSVCFSDSVLWKTCRGREGGQLSSSYQFDIRNNIWTIFLNFGQEDIILKYRDISWKVTTWVQLPILLRQPLKWTTEHKIYIETSSVTKRHFTVQGQNTVYSSLLIYRFVITLSPTACCNHTFVLYEGERGGGLESSKDILGFCQVKSIISVANSGGSPNKKLVMLLDTSLTYYVLGCILWCVCVMHLYDASATCVIFGLVRMPPSIGARIIQITICVISQRNPILDRYGPKIMHCNSFVQN